MGYTKHGNSLVSFSAVVLFSMHDPVRSDVEADFGLEVAFDGAFDLVAAPPRRSDVVAAVDFSAVRNHSDSVRKLCKMGNDSCNLEYHK